MKHSVFAVAFVVAAYMAWQQYKPQQEIAPPPLPPPAILSEPAPVINEAEQAKIIKATEDQDPGVRWESVILLDKMKSPQAMPIMLHMLEKDFDVPLRTKIVELLGNRNSPEVIAALVGALKDTEPEVRIAAIRSIEKIGDYSVASVLASGPIRDQEESVRLQALRTLNALQDKKQADIEAARQSYEQTKQQAALEAAKKR
jgi:HEAT repeat protein